MTYRARPDFRGGAVIKVYGERSRRESPSPVADRGDWVELGCKQVSLIGRDRDTIPVGRREGRFAAIRLQVRGADVEIRDLRVVYANGDPDDIPVRNLIRADSRTRPLDLRGRRSASRGCNNCIAVPSPGSIAGLSDDWKQFSEQAEHKRPAAKISVAGFLAQHCQYMRAQRLGAFAPTPRAGR
jgi:hypothetical protein